MLSEISQPGIYTVWSHLTVESKNPYKLIEKEIRFEVTRGWGCRKRRLDEESQKVQASSYKINKYWGYNVLYNMINIINTATCYIWKLLTE